MNLFDKSPFVAKNAFVAPNASLTGEVYVGPSSSIWYGCVVRGMVFAESNIASCHVILEFECYLYIQITHQFCSPENVL